MPDSPDQAMTVRDVADYLNVDEKTVYRLAKRADLPGFKVAGAWRFRRADLDAWIDQKKKVAQDSGEKAEQ
jgi:excisionase family DNA binding protein